MLDIMTAGHQCIMNWDDSCSKAFLYAITFRFGNGISSKFHRDFRVLFFIQFCSSYSAAIFDSGINKVEYLYVYMSRWREKKKKNKHYLLKEYYINKNGAHHFNKLLLFLYSRPPFILFIICFQCFYYMDFIGG